MPDNPKVSIIILSVNALAMTKEQLAGVSTIETNGLDVECMVIDNGSNDGTEAAIKNYRLPNMTYKFIRNVKNLGFGGGNNVGIKDALSRGIKYIILMNNDLILSKDNVVKLVKYMEGNPDVGLASPKIYFAKGYEFHKGRYSESEKGKVFWYAGGIIDPDNVYTSHRGVDKVDNGQYDKIEETGTASGACVVIRREVFEKIGFLDASLFLYWEDADFSERARRAGYRVVYYPGTRVWHKVSTSAGGSGSLSNDYFLIRNRFYFAMKYVDLRAKFAVLRDTVRLIFAGRPWQKKGAVDALLGIKGKGAWNI